MTRVKHLFFFIFPFVLGCHSNAQTFYTSQLSDFAYFGDDLDINGDRAVIGAPREGNQPHPDQGAAYVFRSKDAFWSLEKTLMSPKQGNERFGTSVALNDTHIIVGAPRALTSNGISGAAYVYTLSKNQEWVWIQTLSPPPQKESRDFGATIDMSRKLLVVGATGRKTHNDTHPCHGEVFVYELRHNVWQLIQTLKITCETNIRQNQAFGHAVAVDASAIAVGAPGTHANSGTVYIYRRSNNALFQLTQHIQAPNPKKHRSFGSSVVLALHKNRLRLGVGAPHDEVNQKVKAGAAYIYESTSGKQPFTLTQKLSSNEPSRSAYFGEALSLKHDKIVIGAPGADNARGALYLFAFTSGTWSLTTKLKDQHARKNARLGASVEMEPHHILAGATGEDVGRGRLDTGAAHGFYKAGKNWTSSHLLTGTTKSATDSYGSGFSAGDKLLVITADTHADLYHRDTEGMSLVTQLHPPPRTSVCAAATDDHRVAIMARRVLGYYGDLLAHINIYRYTPNGVALEQVLKPSLESPEAPETAADSAFLSLFADTLALSVPHFNQGDGQVYLYTHSPKGWSLRWTLTSPQTAVRSHTHFGAAVDISDNIVAISEVPSSSVAKHAPPGKVWIYERPTEHHLTQSQVIYAPISDGSPKNPWPSTSQLSTDDGFGLDLSLDGYNLAILSRSKVFVYHRSQDSFKLVWSTQLREEGTSIDLQGDVLAIGLPSSNGTFTRGSGEIVVYRRKKIDLFEKDRSYQAPKALSGLGLGLKIQVLKDAIAGIAKPKGEGHIYMFPFNTHPASGHLAKVDTLNQKTTR